MPSTVCLICFLDSNGIPLLHIVRLHGIGDVDRDHAALRLVAPIRWGHNNVTIIAIDILPS